MTGRFRASVMCLLFASCIAAGCEKDPVIVMKEAPAITFRLPNDRMFRFSASIQVTVHQPGADWISNCFLLKQQATNMSFTEEPLLDLGVQPICDVRRDGLVIPEVLPGPRAYVVQIWGPTDRVFGTGCQVVDLAQKAAAGEETQIDVGATPVYTTLAGSSDPACANEAEKCDLELSCAPVPVGGRDAGTDSGPPAGDGGSADAGAEDGGA